jgi:hypothetical protein
MNFNLNAPPPPCLILKNPKIRQKLDKIYIYALKNNLFFYIVISNLIFKFKKSKIRPKLFLSNFCLIFV